MKTIVFYHHNCFDGTMAAAAAQKAIYGGILPRDTVLSPISYQDKFFDDGGVFDKVNPTHEVSTVYFLDFCPTADVLKELSDDGHTVVVLDHHETAVKNVSASKGLKGLTLEFDMGRSGAVMAWDYFHKGFKEREFHPFHLPTLALHVGDRDLWKFERAGTREAIAWLSVSAKLNDPQSYLVASREFHSNPQAKIEIGSFIRKEMAVQISNMASKWRWVDIDGAKGAIVNATSYPSEVCEAVYDAHPVPYVIAYNITKDGKVALSFRSKKGEPHSIRVNDLAELFGGGGHPNAAGGSTDLETLHELLLSSKSQSKGVKANSSQACSC